MPEFTRHLWVTEPWNGDLAALIAGLDIGVPLTAAIDANRRLRGPYTAAGAIVRQLVPQAQDSAADLVRQRGLEILTVAPELRGVIPSTRDTLTSLAIPKERTRFYSPNRTARLSHGLTEFIRDIAARAGMRRYLVIANLQDADPTDQEFAAILLRRLDPRQVTLVIGAVVPLDGGLADATSLAAALERYARRLPVGPRPCGPEAPVEREQVPDLAAAYVAGLCPAGQPAMQAAYDQLADDQRRHLHDAQADALEALGEASLRLGAIPFHRERGSDPSGRGAAALAEALNYCIDMGFYDATVDLGQRGRAVIDWQRQVDLYWTFTTKMTTSLAALGRPAAAHALYDEARAQFTRPRLHMQAAYATAMLYTRHYEDERRDHEAAIGWINAAIAIAMLLEEPGERAFSTVFNENGKALIEAHRGRPQEALRLVTEGLARLDRELAPGDHLLHRSVLVHNRAQVLTGLRRLDEALADYNTVIARDPHYDEYYFDRAGLLRQLGRPAEALADYDVAIRLSPPFAEYYYNRADLRAETGDTAGALADFGYVLELSPENVDARINHAALCNETGKVDAARADVVAGLELSPDNPHLLCLLGEIELAGGRMDAAMSAFDAAVAADPALPQAWAARAGAAFQAGDLASALADLDRSLDLAEDPTAFFNRGMIHEARKDWDRAAADFSSALALAPDDADVTERLAASRARLA
jgi:tetratricopeptide (TPR) repeat protein